jgi:hypothetical protein
LWQIKSAGQNLSRRFDNQIKLQRSCGSAQRFSVAFVSPGLDHRGGNKNAEQGNWNCIPVCEKELIEAVEKKNRMRRRRSIEVPHQIDT